MKIRNFIRRLRTELKEREGAYRVYTYHGDAAVLELLYFKILHLLLGLALLVDLKEGWGE